MSGKTGLIWGAREARKSHVLERRGSLRSSAWAWERITLPGGVGNASGGEGLTSGEVCEAREGEAIEVSKQKKNPECTEEILVSSREYPSSLRFV